jgi:hypothetical protein
VSLCAQAGVPIEVVSQRLGHASIGVTVERYLHVYRSRDAEAADAFGRLVGLILGWILNEERFCV